MDILGELHVPTTEKGNRYILVISDYFTKWTEAIAMPNIEAKTVAEIFVTEVVTRFGIPTTLHSDQGAQFESKLFTEMCKLLHIKKTHTNPYHPQSDGMVEFNKTLATMLSSYVNEHHKDWDEYLPFVMMPYRSVEHETTGCSHDYLILGREVVTPIDLILTGKNSNLVMKYKCSSQDINQDNLQNLQVIGKCRSESSENSQT
ncbi:uncharacterized protein K02A2.6-like [Ostrea edulis]|uniref:uncharacterized protein K02A2.6-like n=1 Tax=Ostrea edulis TaxID=37623 RepID=UPI0024AEA6EE|nr:uncharacterized protein K02A2.6-like [Ostrea edulis]